MTPDGFSKNDHPDQGTQVLIDQHIDVVCFAHPSSKERVTSSLRPNALWPRFQKQPLAEAAAVTDCCRNEKTPQPLPSTPPRPTDSSKPSRPSVSNRLTNNGSIVGTVIVTNAYKKTVKRPHPEDQAARETTVSSESTSAMVNLHWRKRYSVVSLVKDGFPFPNARGNPTLLVKYQAAVVGEETTAEAEGFPVGTEQPASRASTPEPTAVLAVLAKYAAKAITDAEVACVVGFPQRCYSMFETDVFRNFFESSSTQELEYRTQFLDRLLETTLQSGWMDWTPGEIENGLIARTRAEQADVEFASAMKHDGIGRLTFGQRGMDVVFLECVGSPTENDKSKLRDDTKKVFKALGAAVDSQRQVVQQLCAVPETREKAFLRLGAFGLVCYQTTLRLYAAKYIDNKTVISEVGHYTVATNFGNWAELGVLMRGMLLLRIRLHFLYKVLKQMLKTIPSIPTAVLPITPDKRRRC
ncbi:hypothetical protein DFS34DRAFT_676018 [Phlyctochytrium arcticum]|nr:hypothetical protein DFS34DRAFT_676018 [Phlyctochytrium arcticum]